MARTAKRDPQIEAGLKRLDELVARSPDLAEPAAFYREVLPLLRAAQGQVESFALSPESARRKLEAGQPLLVGEDLPLDAEAGRGLFLSLCRILESASASPAPAPGRGPKPQRAGWSMFTGGRANPTKRDTRSQNGDGAGPDGSPPGETAFGHLPAARQARQIRRAVEQNELDLAEVWQALGQGAWRRVEIMAAGQELDGEVLHMLAQNSLKPALRAWAQQLAGLADLDQWRRGQCPMCGSPPALSEIQGKEGARRLRCGMCGAGWYYHRLQCAFCANRDHRSLGYASVEGEEEKYRLQTCDVCRGYLKTVVTFDPAPVDLLPVEDLATLHLDLIASERGFNRVPVR